jgi:hypothetical protein
METINLARNSKSILRGIEMTLATVAYRISSDVSFAALLKQNAEEALRQMKIALQPEEKKALVQLMALSDVTTMTGKPMLAVEDWTL